jgi:hypothetical protein
LRPDSLFADSLPFLESFYKTRIDTAFGALAGRVLLKGQEMRRAILGFLLGTAMATPALAGTPAWTISEASRA